MLKKELPVVERIQLAISFAIRIILIIAIISAASGQNWAVLFVTALTLVLTFLPAIIEKNYKIYLPLELQFIITIFIFSSLFLGSIRGYYTRLWWWDIVLHTGSGIALGLAGFLILYTLYQEKKVQASAVMIAVFAFCFAVAFGAVWEIFEFSMDSALGWDMQKSGLVDTMWDLIVDCLGALVSSIAGYFYIKGVKVSFFHRVIEKYVEKNKDKFKP